MWPCSMKVHASRSVSAIFSRTCWQGGGQGRSGRLSKHTAAAAARQAPARQRERDLPCCHWRCHRCQQLRALPAVHCQRCQHRTMTTDRRRRQKEAVDSCSSCARLFLVLMMPMSYSLAGLEGAGCRAGRCGCRAGGRGEGAARPSSCRQVEAPPRAGYRLCCYTQHKAAPARPPAHQQPIS